MGSVCHESMCILLYGKLIQCSGVAEIYGQLEEGVELVCHGYMCILLFVKLIWCSGSQKSILDWRRREVCLT